MTELYHCSHLDLAARLTAESRMVDALIVDAPYSAKTHAGHDDAVQRANKDPGAPQPYRGAPSKRVGMRTLAYPSWSPADVTCFVETWSPLTRGWMVSITDHTLAPTWAAELERAGRYVFAPLPIVISGMAIRFAGDGPSSWAVYAIVARPRTKEFAAWGTLRGAYVTAREAMPSIGGKPLGVLRQIVADYSRPGDLVCDPCCGAGTTLLAAQLEGRRAIGSDIDESQYQLARDRLAYLPSDPSGRQATLPLAEAM